MFVYDEFHKIEKEVRIVYLEDQIFRIKNNIIKFGEAFTDNDRKALIDKYQAEIQELKND